MDGLRWWLLFFGVLVVSGVYLYSRIARDKSKHELDDGERVVPTLENEAADSDEPEGTDLSQDDEEEPSQAQPQKIVTLRLVARDGGFFRGDELILTMRGIGLRHGKFGVFHRFDGSDSEKTIFSAASLVEPGSFDLAKIKEQEIPGISLFLVLPGPVVGVEAFDLMMAAARALAKALDGELLDESGSSLSIQRERYIREEIIQFQHSVLVA